MRPPLICDNQANDGSSDAESYLLHLRFHVLLLLTGPSGMFPEEMSRETHDALGKVLESKENINGKGSVPSSSDPKQAVFANTDMAFAKYSYWVRQR